jgi:hypothetical protein
MRMRIASMTKHFVCFAYLLLCEDGKAGVDEALGQHLPELHSVARGVTARQLMSHTSGLRDVIDIGWQFGGCGRPVLAADLLALYRHIDDVNAAPGACWIYNNCGYLLLGAMIERITGQSLDAVLRERIFDPTGMHDTMLRSWDTDFVPNSAALHMTDVAGRYVRSYLGMELTGDAGVVSTVDDMLRWLAHMDEPKIGSAATWRVMQTPQSLANGTSTGYGLGLVTDEYRGVPILYHDGGVMGGNSRMLKARNGSLDVVVMVNRQDVNAALLVDQILEACLPGLAPPVEQTSAASATGTFQSPQSGRVVQLLAREVQQIASVDGFDVPVTRDEDGILRPLSRYRMLRIEITTLGEAARPDAIRLSDFGNLDELHRVEIDSEQDAASIGGIFRCSTIGTEARIEAQACAGHLRMISSFGCETFALERLADRIWRAKPGNWWPPGGVLIFDDIARTFRFYSVRTRALTFTRIPERQIS